MYLDSIASLEYIKQKKDCVFCDNKCAMLVI